MTASGIGASLEVMWISRVLLPVGAAISLFAANPVTSAAEQAPDSLRRAVERVVAAGAPGAIAIAGGQTAAAGVANLETERRLRARDRVRIGSVTKSFVAVAALQLVGEGRLQLDDTVGELLPGALPQADGVTVRQLLDHTSGIPDDVPSVLQEVFHGDRLRVWTPADLIGLVGDESLRFAPGSGWAYSNTDYVLIGLMIERATGHSLTHELKRRIVHPLGLRHTSFPVRAAGLGARASGGYSLELGPNGPLAGPLRDLTRYSPSFAWASGNGISTIGDVARFYRGLLGGRLLRPDLLQEALTTVPTGQPGRMYGLGLDVQQTAHGPLIGHEGQIPGFDVRALANRSGRRQAVVAVNVKFASPAVEDAIDAAMKIAVRVALRRQGRE